MKEKIDSWREKLSNKYIRSAVFFGFYAIFFGIVFLLMTGTPPHKKDTVDKITDKWELLNNNYEYLYQINMVDDKGAPLNIALLGKRYVNKDIYNKYLNTTLDSTVYTFYNDIYIHQDKTWIKQNNFVKIYPNFDNNLIDLKYIKNIKEKATLVNTINNFDGTTKEDYKYTNDTNNQITLSVTSKGNTINKIEEKTPNVDIVLQYKNINRVQDFVVVNEDK